MVESKKLSHYVDGDWIAGSGPEFRSLNPANTGDVVAIASEADSEIVAIAIAAARRAQPAWAAESPEVRSDLLDRIGNELMRRSDELGALLTREEGKTLGEGIGETQRAARIFKYFSGEALRLSGFNHASTRPGIDARTSRAPVGVFGLIAPWNFPIAIPAWKAAPAMAFGNTVVMKPSPLTPAMANALAEIADEVGIPAGVFNLVQGDAVTGSALSGSTELDGLSFTGSQAVGHAVASAAVANGKKVQLEMGGKNPLVVLDDAEIDNAVACALNGAYFSTGQRCTASSRLVVTQGIHDLFVDRLATAMSELVVGDPCDRNVQIGPLASQAQLDKSLEYLDIAAAEGAILKAGGERLEQDSPGYFLTPALFTETTPDMRINHEEVFGPIASVTRVRDYDEALQVANDTPYGLSAGICTTSLADASHFEKHAQAGMIMVNLPTAGVDYHVPFGGTKGSSYGSREQGFAAYEFYTQLRTSYVAASV